jgi:uncharacterized protein (DUF2147 family)
MSPFRRAHALVAAAVVASIVVSMAGAARAAPGIEGLWASSDDQGKPTGYVRIAKRGDEYYGVIERGLPGDDPARLCEACRGALQGRKMLGLEIISGVRQLAEEYGGGRIVDPFSGNDYRVRLTPSPDGARLQVRGYLGVEIFGRTQTWTRER